MGRGYGLKRQAYRERHVVTPDSTTQPVQDTAVVPMIGVDYTADIAEKMEEVL
jgi:hypothetical protein